MGRGYIQLQCILIQSSSYYLPQICSFLSIVDLLLCMQLTLSFHVGMKTQTFNRNHFKLYAERKHQTEARWLD